MGKISGAQLAAEALIQRGVDTIFTLSGGHITPIYQYLEHGPIELFDTRHEQAAVFMAEAYGRITRKPGVAMVTAGPGFTNTLSAIANARMSNAPLVLISGAVGIESCERLDLQDMRQAPVIEPMVKRAFVCQRPERACEFVDIAFRTAIAGRPGPVYLELPVDVLNAETDEGCAKRTRTELSSCSADACNAGRLLEMIGRAERPVLIAGSGAWYADAAAELTSFVEQTGLPVFTVAMGRGTIPDTHPQCFESSLAIRPGAAMVAHSMADLVVFLGTRISLYYVFGDIFNKEAKIVQVDVEPEEIGRNRSVDLGIVSDVRGLLAECNRRIEQDGLAGGLQQRFSGWLGQLTEMHKDVKDQSRESWESAAVPIHPLRLAAEVDAFMNREDDVVVSDGGDTQIWMGMTRMVRRPAHYLDSGLYGCLGVGLPFANAAKFLGPDKRVCLIIGDGSMGFNFMEFETALRHKLPIVVVVNNDQGWGMIRHSQQLRLGHAIDKGTHIGWVDYHKAVAALGGLGLLVERPEEIRPALEQAFAAGRPACINVKTDPEPISPGSVALANLGNMRAY